MANNSNNLELCNHVIYQWSLVLVAYVAAPTIGEKNLKIFERINIIFKKINSKIELFKLNWRNAQHLLSWFALKLFSLFSPRHAAYLWGKQVTCSRLMVTFSYTQWAGWKGGDEPIAWLGSVGTIWCRSSRSTRNRAPKTGEDPTWIVTWLPPTGSAGVCPCIQLKTVTFPVCSIQKLHNHRPPIHQRYLSKPLLLAAITDMLHL